MRPVAILAAVTGATPAFAHHDVVASASLVPLAVSLGAITIAALGAWRLRRSRKQRP